MLFCLKEMKVIFNRSLLLTALLVLLHSPYAFSQELLAPLSSRPQPVQPTASKAPSVLQLPFFDDFASYEGLPDPQRWLSSQAFVNKDYAPQPPTVGMVTLDALDAYGNLYPHASTNIFAADTLTSLAIRLDSLTGSYQQRLQPSDSIILSFFYIPGGWYGEPWALVGDTPSTDDSLFLDFYDKELDRWVTVWAIPGFTPDTTRRTSHWPWRYASIPIVQPRFLTDRFQFRFRNYASLDANPKSGIAGNCDQWNIDYIYLNRNRSVSDSLARDVAFVHKAPSMLRRYQAMPARQFRPSEMAASLTMTIVNRYNQTLASHYSYSVYDPAGNRIAGYDGGFENIPPFFPGGSYQTNALHSTPPVNFSFPQSPQPSEYTIVHVVREGVADDQHPSNDTVTFSQLFADYYAYDDGVPENGYGLTSPSNRMWLALRFDLNQEDTLSAVDLFFNRTRSGENEDIPFQLCVWQCQDGKPGALLYKDEARVQPLFNGMNRFVRYPLSQSIVVSDTIFVGFEQLSNGYINIGFDRSNDARPYTFSRTGNEWIQSYLRGAIMLRPVFGSSALLAINPPQHSPSLQCSIFPNPAGQLINISSPASPSRPLQLQVFNPHGQPIYSHMIETPHLILHPHTFSGPNTLLLFRITDPASGLSSTQKIIVK